MLVDPGGRAVDYLRSCYSTDMVLSQDGHHSRVDWYFTDPGAPFLGKRSRMVSLNYRRPGVPAGSLGEVTTSARPWRDGSRPTYIAPHDPTYSTGGTDADWLDGVAGNYGPVALDYLGRKLFPYAGTPGTFPPHYTFGTARVFSSVNGEWTSEVIPPFGDPAGWGFPNPPVPTSSLAWYHLLGGPLWDCAPGTYALVAVTRDITTRFHVLQCTSGSALIQTWIDPSGLALAPGEVLTVYPSPLGPEDLMLLATLTAAGSADLRFTGFVPAYSVYQIQIESLVPSVNAGGLRLQFTANAGVTWLSANYSWTDWAFEPSGSGIESGVSVSAISFGGVDRGISSATANGGISATIRIYDPLSSTKNKLVSGVRVFRGPSFGLRLAGGLLSGSYDVAADSINGFRLLFDTGSITSGVVRVYGLTQ